VLLPLLLACVTGAAAWAPLELATDDGDVPVSVAVEVRTRAAPAAVPVQLAWASTVSGAIVGFARGRGWQARVDVSPVEGGGRSLEVLLRYSEPVLLERAALRLFWPGRARAVTTDLSWSELDRPRRVRRGTPILAEAGRLVLAAAEGVEAARYDPGDGSGLAVTLFLDDAADRPFSTYPSCLDRLPASTGGAPVKFAALEHRTRVLDVTRRPGDLDRARVILEARTGATAFLPVVPERWPDGARAAVVFTDHADRSDAPALAALLWGTSDPSAQGRPGRGFLGRGLRITKSFFVHGPAGSLDDPAVAPLAAELQTAGSEIALHSITPARDDRVAVAAGLAAAAPWHPVTWIDHEPYTNCEAVSSQGWSDRGPYGVRDLLVGAGLRWIWSAGDVPGSALQGPEPGAPHVRLLDVFSDDAEARAVIYPLPADPRLWVFSSTFFYATPADLGAALSDGALSALERRRGLFVGHTYLAAGALRTRLPIHMAFLAAHTDPGGFVVLDPALDAALGRIAARAAAGRVASLTWAQAGDRLRSLGELAIDYRADGSAELYLRSGEVFPGLTLAVPAEGLEITADGLPLPHADEPGVTRVFLDLPAGRRVVLRASRGESPVPFLVPP
jgi:hypothetical protein